MVSIRAIYEHGKIILLEEMPQTGRARAIVTILEDWPATTQNTRSEQAAPLWLGALHDTLAGEIADIVSPLSETWSDWEALQA